MYNNPKSIHISVIFRDIILCFTNPTYNRGGLIIRQASHYTDRTSCSARPSAILSAMILTIGGYRRSS